MRDVGKPGAKMQIVESDIFGTDTQQINIPMKDGEISVYIGLINPGQTVTSSSIYAVEISTSTNSKVGQEANVSMVSTGNNNWQITGQYYKYTSDSRTDDRLIGDFQTVKASSDQNVCFGARAIRYGRHLHAVCVRRMSRA